MFRDSAGRVGVFDQHCPHRGASLYFGRNEEGGIRCVYHGWKFDVERALPRHAHRGARQPDARQGAGARLPGAGRRRRAVGVPGRRSQTHRRLPDFEFIGLPDSQVYASRWEQDCNYAQAMEGELDSAHVGFLHRLVDKVDADDRALTGSFFRNDTAPLWQIVPTAAGFVACNGRRTAEGERYWRLNQFLLPFYTMIPPHPNDARLVRMWVPMTDERCWVLCVTFRPDRPLGDAELAAWRNGENSHRRVIPGTHHSDRAARQRLPDRPRVAEDRLVHRHPRHPRAGCDGGRERRPDRRPHARAPRQQRPCRGGDAQHADRRGDHAQPSAASNHRPPSTPHLYRVRATQAVLSAATDPTSCDELIAPALPITPSTEQPLETP